MIGYRDITEADLEMLREHRNRPDTRCFLGDAREVSVAQQLSWFKAINARRHRYCILTKDGEAVGLGRAAFSFEAGRGFACVGANLFARFRGRGLGHEAFAVVCALPVPGDNLWLQVFVENEAAVKIYRRAGFDFDPNATVELRYRTLPGASEPSLLHYVTMRRPA